MEITAITPDFVKALLNAWARGDLADNTIAGLRCLDGAASLDERSLDLYELLRDHTLARLNNYRKAFLAPDHDSVTEEDLLRQDANSQSTELQAWSVLYYRYFYLDGMDHSFIEDKAFLHERRIQRRIEYGVKLLARFLQTKERAAQRNGHAARIAGRLMPLEHHKYFGMSNQIVSLADLLQKPLAPSFVSIEGLGGIGKTALAGEVVAYLQRYAAIAYDDIIWLSAKQEGFDGFGQITTYQNAAATIEDVLDRLTQRILGLNDEAIPYEAALPRVAQMLGNGKYLIVIDNLETLDDGALLLTKLYPLASKARFLLTSRLSLRHISYVYSFQVHELPVTDGTDLLLAEVKRLNTHREISTMEAEQIYTVVGGLPLALRLVAAQVTHQPVDQVLSQLQQIDATQPEKHHELLFRHIYRRTWQLLQEPAKRLLLAMVNVAVEGTPQPELRQRAQYMDFTEAQIVDALEQLQYHALLEITGTQPLYSLHRLTVTFLKSEIFDLRWHD